MCACVLQGTQVKFTSRIMKSFAIIQLNLHGSQPVFNVVQTVSYHKWLLQHWPVEAHSINHYSFDGLFANKKYGTFYETCCTTNPVKV